MALPRITIQERELANTMARDFRRWEDMGAREAAKVGLRVQSRVMRAMRNREDVFEVLRANMHEAQDVLVASMVASHLAGILRAAREVPKSKLARRVFFQSSAFKEAIRFLRQRVGLTPSQVRQVEERYGQAAAKVIGNVTRAVETRIQKALISATQQGLSTRDGAKLIGEAFVRAGITPKSGFALETVFRTQSQLAYSAGRFRADQDPAVQQILWGYKYVTVGDDRVRESHGLMEGMTLEKNDPRWETHWPPNGWNCRCQVIPVFEERKIYEPKAKVIGGRIVEPVPDLGFGFNPGRVLPE